MTQSALCEARLPGALADDWAARLDREAIPSRQRDFDFRYHVSLSPAYPREYGVGGLVAITFREGRRRDGAIRFVTSLDPGAALRIGGRLGLDEAESLAFVDSHERMHVFLQLADVPEDVEEARSRIVDAVWLSLRHPRAAELVLSGEFGVVTRVHERFFEELVDLEAAARK